MSYPDYEPRPYFSSAWEDLDHRRSSPKFATTLEKPAEFSEWEQEHRSRSRHTPLHEASHIQALLSVGARATSFTSAVSRFAAALSGLPENSATGSEEKKLVLTGLLEIASGTATDFRSLLPVRQAATIALIGGAEVGQWAKEPVIDLLLKQLTTQDVKTLSIAVSGLDILAAATTTKLSAAFGQTQDSALRGVLLSGIEAARARGINDAYDALIDLVGHKDTQTRALASIYKGDAEAVPALIRALSHKDSFVASLALSQLDKLNEDYTRTQQGVALLASSVRNPHASTAVRNWSLRKIASAKPAVSAAAITALLSDDTVPERTRKALLVEFSKRDNARGHAPAIFAAYRKAAENSGDLVGALIPAVAALRHDFPAEVGALLVDPRYGGLTAGLLQRALAAGDTVPRRLAANALGKLALEMKSRCRVIELGNSDAAAYARTVKEPLTPSANLPAVLDTVEKLLARGGSNSFALSDNLSLLLFTDNLEIRRRACTLIAACGQAAPSTIGVLAYTLRDEGTRNFALEALKKIHPSPSTVPLLENERSQFGRFAAWRERHHGVRVHFAAEHTADVSAVYEEMRGVFRAAIEELSGSII